MSRFASKAAASGVIAACVLLAVGCGDERVPAPKSYKEWNSKNGAFSCKYPEGWESEGGEGRSDFAWAKFSKGPVEIKVTADLGGSLQADIAKAGNTSDRPDMQPVHMIHERAKKNMSDDFDNYREKAPKVITTGLGDSRVSEFTASGSFGRKLRGYRATALTNDKRVQVVCTCPNTDWKRLKSAFTTVIKSVRR